MGCRFRFRLWQLILALCFPALIGCTDDMVKSDAVKYQETTKGEMIGMTKEETFTCLGMPLKNHGINPSNVWSYGFGTCVVNLTMEGDRVHAVNYTTRPPEFKTLPLGVKKPEVPDTVEEQCAVVPEVQTCVRWLRNPA